MPNIKRELPKTTTHNEGFTAAYLKPVDLKNAPLSSWTQTYHKPYQCDIGEARVKAIARKAEDGDDLTKEWEANGKKSYWLKYDQEPTDVRERRKEMLKNGGAKLSGRLRGEKGMDNYIYTMYTDATVNPKKTYVTVQDANTEKYVTNKDEVLKIANKYYFKAKADKIKVQWAWLYKDDLYPYDPKLASARKVYCATRV